MPAYSYRFILDKFKPALSRLGEVVEVSDPFLEIPRLQAEAAASGKACRLICFCPPNLVPASLNSQLLSPSSQDCPVSVVICWGYDSIPTTSWNGNHRNDWRTILNENRQAITLSEYSRASICKAMGKSYHASVIPVPQNTTCPPRESPISKTGQNKIMHFRGLVVDSHDLRSVDAIRLLTDDLRKTCTMNWDGKPVELEFKKGSLGSEYLVGFYGPEHWGAWSRKEYPSILLPFELRGCIEIRLVAAGYGRNLEKELILQIGPHRKTLRLTANPESHSLSFTLDKPTSILRFGPFEVEPIPGARDGRTMGIGLTALRIKSHQALMPYSSNTGKTLAEPIDLSGIVFLTVLNPGEERKNWADILRAFAYALGGHRDAILVIKMSHHSAAIYIEKLLDNLDSIEPINARVVVLHGHLDEGQYQSLRERTAWYVNASSCEGFCLPLAECMAAGIPAIAPYHTALEDYVDSSSTLVVHSNRTPGSFPEDPSMKYRCTQYKINWQSLVDQLREGYRIAKEQHERYESMSYSARLSVEHKMSTDQVSSLLAAHFEGCN